MVNISNYGLEMYVFLCNLNNSLSYRGNLIIALEMVLNETLGGCRGFVGKAEN